jgi:uncharacterized membrane protein YjjB (DUF3815 family)
MFDMLTLFLQDAFWSAAAAVGFAVLFNVPRRMLLGCAAVGAAGHALRFLLVNNGLPIEAGTLFGAGLVGVIASLLARHYKTPTLIFAIVGAIPMVPGTFAYRSMVGLIDMASINAASPTAADSALLVETAINFVKTGLLLASIALGITIPALLLRRRKPVV